ncbi:hypothetical protein HDU78_006399 [Chytriomyces hyalinus]|nr:hypothetical protein HDU78_006399 [Chytriomyces hyalinus]
MRTADAPNTGPAILTRADTITHMRAEQQAQQDHVPTDLVTDLADSMATLQLGVSTDDLPNGSLQNSKQSPRSVDAYKNIERELDEMSTRFWDQVELNDQFESDEFESASETNKERLELSRELDTWLKKIARTSDADQMLEILDVLSSSTSPSFGDMYGLKRSARQKEGQLSSIHLQARRSKKKVDLAENPENTLMKLNEGLQDQISLTEAWREFIYTVEVRDLWELVQITCCAYRRQLLDGAKPQLVSKRQSVTYGNHGVRLMQLILTSRYEIYRNSCFLPPNRGSWPLFPNLYHYYFNKLYTLMPRVKVLHCFLEVYKKKPKQWLFHCFAFTRLSKIPFVSVGCGNGTFEQAIIEERRDRGANVILTNYLTPDGFETQYENNYRENVSARDLHNYDWLKTMVSSHEEVDILFNCPWADENINLPILLCKFLESAGKLQKKGSFVFIGITEHPKDFDKYRIGYVFKMSSITYALHSIDSEIIQMVRPTYKHHSDIVGTSSFLGHSRIYPFHVMLCFKRL